MLGIIGGTGLNKIKDLVVDSEEKIDTPFGAMSAPVSICDMGGKKIAFLPRHGKDHDIPPHKINYRANIWGLQHFTVNDIISIATVGSIKQDITAGMMVLPDQIIDYTYGREHTFFDGVNDALEHIDFTYPFDTTLRTNLMNVTDNLPISLVSTGVYAAVQGPRLETAAEIDRYEKDGATIVGMTCMPEAALARELKIAYMALCPVANKAAGRGSSSDGISHQEITQQSKGMMDDVIQMITSFVEHYGN